MLDPEAPWRKRESARNSLRELVGVANSALSELPRENEGLRRRLEVLLCRINRLTGGENDPVAFDSVFRDAIPDEVEAATTADELSLLRDDPGSLTPELLARLISDADRLRDSLDRQSALQERLDDANAREIGLHDGRNMFERLRINERRPVVGKHSAMHPVNLRQVIGALDAAGLVKAADTLIWAVWHHDNTSQRCADVVRHSRDETESRRLALGAAYDALRRIKGVSGIDGTLLSKAEAIVTARMGEIHQHAAAALDAIEAIDAGGMAIAAE